jgi:molybdenum cofactor biosynthesis enzyme MoaA
MSIDEYPSCEYLQSGLVFFPNRIAACCVSHTNGLLGQPILSPFSGGVIPINTITTNRSRIIALHQDGGVYPQCDGCPRLIKAQWGQPEYPVEEITIAHFTHCNLRCSYCYTINTRGMTIHPNEVYSLLPVFRQLIEQKMLSPNAIVRFSGGEPTILPEFEDLLDMIISYGPRLIIYSNAVVLSQAILRSLARKKVELVLGVDAASPEVYKRIKGADRCNVVWSNVASYARVDPDAMWVKMIVRYDNMTDVLPFVNRVEAVGARKVYYDLDAGAAGMLSELEQVIQAAAHLKFECEKRGIATACAEAGSQALAQHDVEKRIEAAMDAIAMQEPTGRQLLFKRRLINDIGLDWALFEQAKTKLGPAYADILDQVVAQIVDSGGPAADPTAWLSQLDTIYEQAYLSNRVEPVDRYEIDLCSQFPGTNWGTAEKNIHYQRWRWLGPRGISQLYLTLVPDTNYLVRVFIHTADSMETLQSLHVWLNGRPSKHFGLTTNEEGLSLWCLVHRKKIMDPSGFLRLSLAIGDRSGSPGAVNALDQLRKIAFSRLVCHAYS